MILQHTLKLIVLLLLPLFIGMSAFSQTYDERLESIQEQVREKQRTIGSSINELEQLLQQLGQSARNLSEAKRNLEKSVENISAIKSSLSVLNKQAHNLSLQHANHLSLLAQGLRSMQHDARTHRFGYLLSANDWNDFEQRAVYYDYFNRERKRQLSQLSKQLSDLSDVRMALNEQSHLLESEHSQQQKILQKIEYERQKKKHTVNSLEKKITQERLEIKLLKKDAAELHRLIKQFGALSAPSVQFHTLKGKLPWPLDGPISARLNSDKLPGIFLTADANTEVKSIHDGHVVFSDWFRSYGMLLIIDHGDGYMSLYANNETLYKDVGDAVRSGERIAEVGSGGTSSDIGLYFEIRKSNEQLNPKLWCYRQHS